MPRETVRVVVLGDCPSELRLRPWESENRIIAVAPLPPAQVRDPRFKRRLRDNLHGTGFGFDSRWQPFRGDGRKQTCFAVFSVTPRLRRRHLPAEKLLDVLEGAFRQSFKEPSGSHATPTTLVAA